MTNPFTWLLNNVFWKLVFWWKKQTGFLDMGQTIEVIGTVIALDVNVTGPANDGDVCFNVCLDPGQDRYITGFGGRLTTESETDPTPAIHCEITPWDRSKFDGKWQQLKVGSRVRVKGAWGFDGVHAGVNEFLEVLWALVRHMPYVKTGWFEIHPVEELEILTGVDGVVSSLNSNSDRIKKLAGIKEPTK